MQNIHFKMVIKTIKSKIFILIVSLAWAVSIIVGAYFFSLKDLQVLPNNPDIQFIAYTDSSIGGNSQVADYLVADSLVKINFKLNSNIKSPYVGVCIAPKDKKVFNLARYNELNIKVKGKGLNILGLTLYEPYGIAGNESHNKEIVYYTTISIDSLSNNYTIPLQQFKVPSWWFELNNQSSGAEIKPDLENVVCLNICNAYTSNIDEQKSLEISSLTFTRNNTPLLLWLLLANFLIASVAFIILFRIEKGKSRKSSVTITYKPVEFDAIKASKSDIISYINHHFQNSELTLEMVSSETGVNQRRITNHIQQHYDCNFKTYLNHLRINESKRLLLETGLNIGEIAYKVGFNNQSHFNRVFKTELNINPSEYRERNAK
jgi:AraC-like DNA-binding protein